MQSFTNAQPPTEGVRALARADAQMRDLLQSGVHGVMYESRAMGESGSASALVPVSFAQSVLYWLREFQTLIADCEDYPTGNGAEHRRPQVSSFVASGSAAAENSQLSDSTASLVAFQGQQDFPQAPAFATMLVGSLQMLQDSFQQSTATNGYTALGAGNVNGVPVPAPVVDLGSIGNGSLTQILAKAGAESIGRQVASAASAALYAGATTGQEIALSGSAVTPSSVAGLLAGIVPAYLASGAKIYVSPTDYAKMAAADITGLRHLSDIIPVCPTNSATSYVAGTVSGPVLANLANWLTFRHVGSVGVQVLSERYAELLQFGVRVHLRASFLTTGAVSAAAYAK